MHLRAFNNRNSSLPRRHGKMLHNESETETTAATKRLTGANPACTPDQLRPRKAAGCDSIRVGKNVWPRPSISPYFSVPVPTAAGGATAEALHEAADAALIFRCDLPFRGRKPFFMVVRTALSSFEYRSCTPHASQTVLECDRTLCDPASLTSSHQAPPLFLAKDMQRYVNDSAIASGHCVPCSGWATDRLYTKGRLDHDTPGLRVHRAPPRSRG